MITGVNVDSQTSGDVMIVTETLLFQNMKTTVVNLHDTPNYDVYGGRSGKGKHSILGNPFTDEASRSISIAKYKTYFYHRMKTDPSFARYVYTLRGKTITCFCKPKKCHLDVVAEFLNSGEVII